MRNRRYLRLTGATQSRIVHDKDTTLVNVETLKNFIPGIDGCPALRDDFEYETERVMSCAGIGSAGLVASDTEDSLNAIVESRNGQTCWWSRFFAFQTTGGTATVKNLTYTTGTVSGTTGTTGLTGSGTAWLQNAWPGCLLKLASDDYVYRVASVTDDTTIVLDGNLTETHTNSTYVLYQVHNGKDAEYPLNIQQFGNYLIYNSEDPEPPVTEANISGPFINTTVQGAAFVDWATIVPGTTWPTGNQKYVIFGNSYWLANSLNGIWYASDPEGAWTAATGDPAGFIAGLYSSSLTHFVVLEADYTTTQGVYEDSDGTGATWTARTSVPMGTDIAEGAANFVVVGGSGAAIYYSGDLTGAWSTATGIAGLKAVTYDGTNFIAVGDDGGAATSDDDGATWTSRTSGTTENLTDVATDSSTVVVAVGENGAVVYSEDNGVTWADANVPVSTDWRKVHWSGTYFVASGGDQYSATRRGYVIRSTDGIDWVELDVGMMGEAGYWFTDCVPSDAALSNLMIVRASRNEYNLYYGDAYVDTATEFGDFRPLSSEYRSKAFTVAGSFIMLGGMSEWSSDTSSWVYHPRRWRWPAPGTHNDWDGEGAGFLDVPGVGETLVARTVGTTVLAFDTTGVGVLEQTDDLDSPWGYRRLRDGVRPISNLLPMGNQIFFVAHDGRLWQSNGIQIAPFSSFDLSEFDDWEALGGKPVHLAWYPAWNAMLVFKRTNSGTDHRVWIIAEDGRISYITLPTWTDTGPNPDATRRPLSMFVSQEAGTRLYIGYNADTSADSNQLISDYLNKGSYVRGVDTITTNGTTLTSRWWGELQTGYERLSDEGDLVNVNAVEVYGYAGYTGRISGSSAKEPTIGIQIKDQDSTVWRSGSDSVGTITIGTATCTGSGTAWSNLIAAGDDASTVFTLPCLATQARIYRETGGTYTLQALTTNYTITSAKVITLTAVLATGTNLYAFWDAYPYVQMETGDLIIGASTVHKVTSVTTATAVALDSYLSSGTDATALHVPGEIMEANDGSTIHGIAKRVDPVRLKITVLPQDDAGAPSSVRLTGLLIEFTPLEAQEKRKD